MTDRMVGTIAVAEARSHWRSPALWLVLALLSTGLALRFLQHVEGFLIEQPRLALQDHPIGVSGYMALGFLAPLTAVLALLGPLLAMRAFSGEFRGQTMSLWFSSPISSRTLVLGKFLGTLGILLPVTLLPVLMVASLAWFTSLDVGVLASSTLGLILVALGSAAAGLLFSSLTRQPILALIGCLSLLALLWLPATLGGPDTPGYLLSPAAHLAGFFQGYPDTGSIVYHLVFTALFVALTAVRLDALRTGGR